MLARSLVVPNELAKSMQQFEHSVVAWLGAGRESFVEALTPETRVFGKLRHATSARHIAHRSKEDIGIWILKCGGNVFSDGFLVVEVIGSVEGGEFGHGSLLIQSPRHF